MAKQSATFTLMPTLCTLNSTRFLSTRKAKRAWRTWNFRRVWQDKAKRKAVTGLLGLKKCWRTRLIPNWDSADAKPRGSAPPTVKGNLMVSSDLSRDLEARLCRLIKQDEVHSSRQDEIPRPHPRLDPVAARRNRPGIAASAWNTAANRRTGHAVSRVRLGAPAASPRTAVAACSSSEKPASLAERPYVAFPACSSPATKLCPLPFYREPVSLNTFQAA